LGGKEGGFWRLTHLTSTRVPMDEGVGSLVLSSWAVPGVEAGVIEKHMGWFGVLTV